MTWKEFKEVVEAKGVTDDMEIWYIDLDEDITSDVIVVQITPSGVKIF